MRKAILTFMAVVLLFATTSCALFEKEATPTEKLLALRGTLSTAMESVADMRDAGLISQAYIDAEVMPFANAATKALTTAEDHYDANGLRGFSAVWDIATKAVAVFLEAKAAAMPVLPEPTPDEGS